MPYVIRDENGRVVGMGEVPLDDAAEEVSPADPQLLALLGRTGTVELGGDEDAFVASDLAFIRVLEDLIEVLIRRGAIQLADLPPAAQDKLRQRRALRYWLDGVLGDDDRGG